MAVSTLSYGASTSSTDNTAAINRAIAAAKAQNTTVEIPAGNFRHFLALFSRTASRLLGRVTAAFLLLRVQTLRR